MINTDTGGHTIENIAVLGHEYQPSLPKQFPKSLIPQETCGHPLASLLLCTMNSQTNQCGDKTKVYYMCRRERDAQLFSNLKNWEIEHFQKLNPPGKAQKKGTQVETKQNYMDTLRTEHSNLKKEFEQMPPVIANKHKRWRYQSDIDQLNWRLKYLEPLI